MIPASALIAGFQKMLVEHWGYIWGMTHEMWSAEQQAAYVARYSGDPNRASSCEYGGKWAGHWVTDCSGAFAYWFSVLGGYMYHGSNTMWDKYCVSKGDLKNGKRTDGQDLRPGTAVFCYNADKKRRSHVGLYIGDGHIIEASGTINGVIMTKITNRKWVEWGELKGVIYDAEVTIMPTEPAEVRPTLRRGSKGEWVTLLQSMLVNRGYDVGAAGVDGDFGKATQAAVTKFQLDHCLVMDGIVGPATWAALDEASEKVKTFSVTVDGLTLDQAKALLKQYPTANVTEEV